MLVTVPRTIYIKTTVLLACAHLHYYCTVLHLAIPLVYVCATTATTMKPAVLTRTLRSATRPAAWQLTPL